MFLMFLLNDASSSKERSCCRFGGEARLVKRFWYTFEVLLFCCLFTAVRCLSLLCECAEHDFHHSAEQRLSLCDNSIYTFPACTQRKKKEHGFSPICFAESMETLLVIFVFSVKSHRGSVLSCRTVVVVVVVVFSEKRSAATQGRK